MGTSTSRQAPDVRLVNPLTDATFLSNAHSNMVRALLRIDHSRFATSSDDGCIMIWDAVTGARILAWQAHERPVTALLTVDHQHLVSGSSSGQLRVWNSFTGDLVFEKQAHSGSIKTIALLHQHLPATASSSPAPAQKSQWPERQFLSVGNDADACVWNLRGTLLSVFHMSTAQENLQSTLIVSGHRLVVATDSPHLLLFSLLPPLSSQMGSNAESRVMSPALSRAPSIGNLQAINPRSPQPAYRPHLPAASPGHLSVALAALSSTAEPPVGFDVNACRVSRNHEQVLRSQHRDSVQQLLRIGSSMFVSASLDGAIVIWSDQPTADDVSARAAGRLRIVCTLNYHEVYVMQTNTQKRLLYPVNAMHRLGAHLLVAAIGSSFCVYDLRGTSAANSIGRLLLEVPQAHGDVNISQLTSVYGHKVLVTAAADASIRLWRLDQLYSVDAAAVDSCVVLGSVQAEALLIAELPAHDESVKFLLQLSDHSFVSCDERPLLVMWKDSRLAFETRSLLAQHADKLQVYQHAAALSAEVHRAADSDASPLPCVNALLLLPPTEATIVLPSLSPDQTGPILACACSDCAQFWCATCFARHPLLNAVRRSEDQLNGSNSMDDTLGIERASIVPTSDAGIASTFDQKKNASDAPPMATRSAGDKSKSFDEALATARRLHDREQMSVEEICFELRAGGVSDVTIQAISATFAQ